MTINLNPNPSLRCVPVYQHSSVQVLTQFTAMDASGRTTHLLGSSDWFVDVTELVATSLRIENPSVAYLGSRNNVIGLRPGKTSLYVRPPPGPAGGPNALYCRGHKWLSISSFKVTSEQWDGALGRCDITVAPEPVTLGDLSVQVVSGLGMSVAASPAHPSVVTATVTAYNILYNYHQVSKKGYIHT